MILRIGVAYTTYKMPNLTVNYEEEPKLPLQTMQLIILWDEHVDSAPFFQRYFVDDLYDQPQSSLKCIEDTFHFIEEKNLN